MTIEHLPLLHRLDSDPDVMRHLLGRARTPEEINEFWTPRCADTIADDAGLGWWVGFHGDTFLGWWDLGRSDSLPEAPVQRDRAEIGWRVERQHWRQGFATEGAMALLEYAFDAKEMQLIWAETMAVNDASRCVMRKIGMRHSRTELREWQDPLPGVDEGEVIYEISARDWRRQHA